MPRIGGGSQRPPMSQQDLRTGGQRASQVSRQVSQATQKVDAVCRIPAPQEPRSAATFEKNLKEAAQLAQKINKKSTELGKKSAKGAKALPAAEQKTVAKEIGKHVQLMDKGGTDLDKAMLKLQKSAAAGKAKQAKQAKPADDKKALAASQDLVKQLKQLLGEMEAVDKEVLEKFAH